MAIDYRIVSVRYGTVPGRDEGRLSEGVSRARTLIQSALNASSGHGISPPIERFLRDELSQLDYERGASRPRCTLSVQTPETLRELSTPYGVKGGVPRELLAAAVHRRSYIDARDVDLVRVGRSAVPEDDLVARRWMPEDFRRGHGVELIHNLDAYFKGRDITVNEVVLFEQTISMSLMAVIDTAAMTYRPCRYRLGSLHRSAELFGGTALKMIRLWSEAQIRNEPWQVVGIPERVHIRDLDLAIQVRKALERSRECAELFVSQCDQVGLLSGWGSGITLDDVLDELSYLTVGENPPLPPTATTGSRNKFILPE